MELNSAMTYILSLPKEDLWKEDDSEKFDFELVEKLLIQYGEDIVLRCSEVAKTEKEYIDLDTEDGSFDTYIVVDKGSILKVREEIW